MKWLVGWGIVFVLSWGVGALVCGITLWMKHFKATKIAALVFFGLPVIGVCADLINQKRILYNFEQAKEEVARLCAKDGGDKIYRKVENVQGVFQMRARLPDHYRKPDGTFYNAMSDQYGMEDPYGRAQGDTVEMAMYVGESSVFPNKPPHGSEGYWFIEQLPSRVSSGESGYRRTHWSVAENPPEQQVDAKEGKAVIEVKKARSVSRLLSRYGYLTEDLTTKEMRDNWIGAGRIKIIDLQTNEMLAERKGYFRASGDLLPARGLRWTASGAFHQKRICPSDSSLLGFLHSVLLPPKGFPIKEQLESISEE